MKICAKKYPALKKVIASGSEMTTADFGLDDQMVNDMLNQAYLLVQESNKRIQNEFKSQGLDPYTEAHPGAFVKAKNPESLMQFIEKETRWSLSKAQDLLEKFGVELTDQNLTQLVGFMSRMAHETYVAN